MTNFYAQNNEEIDIRLIISHLFVVLKYVQQKLINFIFSIF